MLSQPRPTGEPLTRRVVCAVRLFGGIHGTGVVLSFGCVLPSRAPLQMYPLAVGDCEGPQWAQGHFKHSAAGANCTVLLMVLCLWEGGGADTMFVAKAVALLWGLFWGGVHIRCSHHQSGARRKYPS